jgi:hypothetical protein
MMLKRFEKIATSLLHVSEERIVCTCVGQPSSSALFLRTTRANWEMRTATSGRICANAVISEISRLVSISRGSINGAPELVAGTDLEVGVEVHRKRRGELGDVEARGGAQEQGEGVRARGHDVVGKGERLE